MKYKDFGFRGVYKQFNAIYCDDKLIDLIKEEPGGATANCVLTYGYIDPDQGLMVEIIAPGVGEGDTFRFTDGNPNKRLSFSAREIGDKDLYWFTDEDQDLSKRYSDKLELLKVYDVSEAIEKTRYMDFLDDVRNPYLVDIYDVILIKEGCKEEVCKVRMGDLLEHAFMGLLVEEPKQNFDYHIGDEIAFTLVKEDTVKAYSNLNPRRYFTEDELEDGSLLKDAIYTFTNEQNEENLIEVLSLLRDSSFWVSCLPSSDRINYVQNDEHTFLPIYTNIEDMGHIEGHLINNKISMMEIIELYEKEEGLSGILLNPYSDLFLIDPIFFPLIKKLKTRIKYN